MVSMFSICAIVVFSTVIWFCVACCNVSCLFCSRSIYSFISFSSFASIVWITTLLSSLFRLLVLYVC